MESVHKLRIFAEVYRTLNVTKAAEQMYMTQPAVSRAIRELEDEYHIKLFERYHHKLMPTARAELLYKRAIHILESIDELNDVFGKHVQVPLKIGASITIGRILLPDLIARFNHEYPDVPTEIMIAPGGTLQKMLMNNELDLAMIEDSVLESDLETIPFFHDEMILILPVSHPLSEKPSVSLHDLADYPFLMREKGSAGRAYLDHLFALNNISLSPVWQSTSTHALINAVAAGIGISVLPKMLCEEAIEKGTILTRPLNDAEMKRTYYIVTHKDKFFSDELTDFRMFCMKEIDR